MPSSWEMIWWIYLVMNENNRMKGEGGGLFGGCCSLIFAANRTLLPVTFSMSSTTVTIIFVYTKLTILTIIFVCTKLASHHQSKTFILEGSTAPAVAMGLWQSRDPSPSAPKQLQQTQMQCSGLMLRARSWGTLPPRDCWLPGAAV